MDHLNNFVKECFWMDGVASLNFSMSAHKEFEVDGVSILKGTNILYNLMGVHKDPV